MFLHLGDDVIILKKSIIGIFDKDICTNSVATREFLDINESEKKVTKIGNSEKVKTFVLTNEGIYLSPISSNTLVKRFIQLDAFE
ncbi:MAG: DUF370 domain-containing protein [Clostridia bacterium]|nr:DUF370 domain-containing protein [Clostridia bacterium]